MSMYSSRPPFNVDPEPMLDTRMGRRAAVADVDLGWEYSPRIAFNLRQANPTNPILDVVRSQWNGEPRGGDYWVVEALNGLEGDRGQLKPEHVKHARSVMKRLAALRELSS